MGESNGKRGLDNPIFVDLSPTLSSEERKGSWAERLISGGSGTYTKRQMVIAFVFMFAEFFAATIISIQAPFFPHVAAGKGATPIETGLVFGIFELTVFIMSPIFGACMSSSSPKRLFNWGIFTTGTCCLIFGTLNLLEDRASFVMSSLVVRTVEAVGDAAFVVASFTIIAIEFPDSVAQTFGIMETFYGLGLIGGPTVGGALYELGGYSLPFAAMGGFLLLTATVTHFLLPEPDEEKRSQQSSAHSGFAMFKILRQPSIFITAYSIVATTAGVGFLHATLEQRIDHNYPGMNKMLVGGIFILNGGVYALSAPTWGKLCDGVENPKVFSVIGSICTVVGFFFVGPLLPIGDGGLWNICVGLVFFGLGLGSTLVSAFVQAMQDCVAIGYADDVGTYGLVSGLWTSMTALGFFLGSVSGGFLISYVGFRWGTLFVIGAQTLLLIMLTVHFIQRRQGQTRNNLVLSTQSQTQNKGKEALGSRTVEAC